MFGVGTKSMAVGNPWLVQVPEAVVPHEGPAHGRRSGKMARSASADLTAKRKDSSYG